MNKEGDCCQLFEELVYSARIRVVQSYCTISFHSLMLLIVNNETTV